MVIAIDGTSGSGKSTLAKLVAQRTSFELLNTGLLYRKITKECLDRGILYAQESAVAEVARSISLNGIENEELHSEEISRNVPYYARIPSVRTEVRKIQHEIGNRVNIVVEGRDIASVVFPDAKYKFFITATLETRAIRRQRQLAESSRTNLQEIMKNLEERDHQDEHRSSSPLLVSSDAEVIDTTEMTLEEVVGQV